MRAVHGLPFVVALCVACGSGSKQITFDNGTPDSGGNDEGGMDCTLTGTCFPGGDAGPDGMTIACNPDPANFDIPGNGCDDDGDGMVDNLPNCDSALTQAGTASQFANAIELCQTASGTKWGVVSATYADAFGSPNAPPVDQHGILPKFGNLLKPRANKKLGALSSGYAQEFDQCNGGPGPFKGGCSMAAASNVAAPPGYPKPNLGCTVSTVVNDYASVKLKIKVPANAKGFSFDFDFGSGEWPEYVCTTFNDSFIAYLQSSAFNKGTPDNISFDKNNNPLSVNNAFFEDCAPTGAEKYCTGVQTVMTANKAKPPACAGTVPKMASDANLMGTGFEDTTSPHCSGGPQDSGGGMTGWLTTKAPVTPGETMTIEFMVWDVGDHIYDSSVLIDNFQWQGDSTGVTTDRPPN